MSKKDEALKLALEALVDARVRPPHKQDSSKYEHAITAIRKALAEQPAQQQEPVAYIRKDQLQKAAQSPMLCEVTPEPRQDRIGIYTSPPASKPWVGLSRDELKAGSQIEDAKSGAALDLSTAFWAGARWAEANLREKNA